MPKRKFGDQARKKLEKERYDRAKSARNTAKGDASIAALAAEKAAKEKAISDMANSARNTAITRERDRRNNETNKNQQVEIDRQTEMAKQKAREFSLKQKSIGKISAGQAKTQQRSKDVSSQWKTVGSKSILKGKTDNEIRAMFPINGKLSLSDEKTLERITFEDYQRQQQSNISSDTIDQFKDATAQTQQRAKRVSERLKQKREATFKLEQENKRIAEEQENKRIAAEEAQRIAAESQKKAILAQQNASKAASVAKIASGQQQTAARSGLVLDNFKDNVAKKTQAASQAAAESKIAAEKAQQATFAAEQASAAAQQATNSQRQQEIAFKNQQYATNSQIKVGNIVKKTVKKTVKYKSCRPILSKRLKQIIRDIKTLVSI